ncbi:MAG: transporter substrate-binding domain-containing protein [Candidatus Cloacimonetes bacterium]|nr:transporter substrate-binding domain-containing protein [Candidatus Cloacimonadota bacterium]
MKRCILLLLLMLGAGYCLGAENSLNGRTIIVGGDFYYPPYEYLDDSGIPKGYNVDLMREIARLLDFQLEFRLAKWAKVREWLIEGEIDLIEGMAYSVQRSGEQIHFSAPHNQTWRAVFANKSKRFKRLSDILSARVVVQQGDIAEEVLQNLDFKGTITYVPTQEDALTMVDRGDHDAAILNYMFGMHLMNRRNFTNLEALPDQILTKDYCIASMNETLIYDIDAALSILSRDGSLERLHRKWFAQYDPKLMSRAKLVKRLVITLLLGFVMILIIFAWVLLLKRRIKHKTFDLEKEHSETEELQKQLKEEYNVFLKGPVIVIKISSTLPNVVFLTENVSQYGWDWKQSFDLDDFVQRFIHEADRIKLTANLLKLIESRATVDVATYRILTRDQETIWMLGYSIIYPDKALPEVIESAANRKDEYTIYTQFLNIQTQVRLEEELLDAKLEAERSNQLKNQFLANMSHEIRTPLNGIFGMVQNILHSDCQENIRESFEDIYTTARSLNKLVDDILEFSMLESQLTDIPKRCFDIRRLIYSTINTFFPVKNPVQGKIKILISDKVPDLIFGDPIHLKQILMNLLHNSYSHIKEGWIEISLDLYNQNQSEIRLIFCLSDTGIGFDKREQQDIFDSISPNQTMLSTKYGRKGLGLAIVRSIIEHMNGFIWMEDRADQGSSFYFIIPFTVVETQSTDPDSQAKSLMQETTIPRMRALIVEDDPINQIVLKKQLEHWNQEAVIVSDGQQAVDIVQKDEFNYILMDIQMPVLDGIQATIEIRKLEAGTDKHLPIFAVTAAAMVGDKERFIASGMDGYIPKPVDSKLLRQKIIEVGQNLSVEVQI